MGRQGILTEAPESLLPPAHRDFISPGREPARAPYRTGATPRFGPDDVEFLAAFLPSRSGTLALVVAGSVLVAAGGAGLLLAGATLSGGDVHQGLMQMIALALSMVSIVPAVVGSVLLWLARGRGQKLASHKAGVWRFGLFLFPDALVIRRPPPRGCDFFPRADIISFAGELSAAGVWSPAVRCSGTSGQQKLHLLPWPAVFGELRSLVEHLERWRRAT